MSAKNDHGSFKANNVLQHEMDSKTYLRGINRMAVSHNHPHRFCFHLFSMQAFSWTDEDHHGPLSGLLGQLLSVLIDAAPFLNSFLSLFRFQNDSIKSHCTWLFCFDDSDWRSKVSSGKKLLMNVFDSPPLREEIYCRRTA